MKTNQKNTIQKSKMSRSKKLFVVLGVLFAMLVLTYVFRGWFRVTVIPSAVTQAYGHNIQETMDEEIAKLQDPLKALGYKDNLGYTKVDCNMIFSQGLSTQLSCGAFIHSYYEIDQSAESKAELKRGAENVQKLLQANGWAGQYTEDGEYTSLKKLVGSITAGIDYVPDAYYQKTIGDVQCMFDTNTAFATPSAPAMASRFDCWRTVNFFGEPAFL